MTPDQYLKESSRTAPHFAGPIVDGFFRFFAGEPQAEPMECCIDTRKVDLLHAAMGMTTEAGEFMDALKKHLIYGKPLDIVNLNEEMGDLLWYIAMGLRVTGMSFEQCMQLNIEKLRKRFPDKFTETEAIHRDTVAERKILEGPKLMQRIVDECTPHTTLDHINPS